MISGGLKAGAPELAPQKIKRGLPRVLVKPDKPKGSGKAEAPTQQPGYVEGKLPQAPKLQYAQVGVTGRKSGTTNKHEALTALESMRVNADTTKVFTEIDFADVNFEGRSRFVSSRKVATGTVHNFQIRGKYNFSPWCNIKLFRTNSGEYSYSLDGGKNFLSGKQLVASIINSKARPSVRHTLDILQRHAEGHAPRSHESIVSHGLGLFQKASQTGTSKTVHSTDQILYKQKETFTLRRGKQAGTLVLEYNRNYRNPQHVKHNYRLNQKATYHITVVKGSDGKERYDVRFQQGGNPPRKLAFKDQTVVGRTVAITPKQLASRQRKPLRTAVAGDRPGKPFQTKLLSHNIKEQLQLVPSENRHVAFNGFRIAALAEVSPRKNKAYIILAVKGRSGYTARFYKKSGDSKYTFCDRHSPPPKAVQDILRELNSR